MSMRSRRSTSRRRRSCAGTVACAWDASRAPLARRSLPPPVPARCAPRRGHRHRHPGNRCSLVAPVGAGRRREARAVRGARVGRGVDGSSLPRLAPVSRRASLYFTFFFRCPTDPEHAVARWAALKRAATAAVVAAGGTLSHTMASAVGTPPGSRMRSAPWGCVCSSPPLRLLTRPAFSIHTSSWIPSTVSRCEDVPSALARAGAVAFR